jgi:hypothetical protein
MIVLVLFLILGVLLGNVFGETSAGNLADAQQGLADSSWPKKPGSQVSSFSGKITDFKQLDMKNYEKGKSFQGARLYGDEKESKLVSTPLWEKGISSYSGKESSWSGKQASGMDGAKSSSFANGRESSWQNKSMGQLDSIPRKESPDWASRTSPKFQKQDGGLPVYEGRLTRIRETVARQEPGEGRDLGEGKKEMFNPNEVQRLLEQRGRTVDPHHSNPEKVPIRAGSGEAFRPVVADSSPSSP